MGVAEKYFGLQNVRRIRLCVRNCVLNLLVLVYQEHDIVAKIGKAAVCKTVIVGSNPANVSISCITIVYVSRSDWRERFATQQDLYRGIAKR